MPFAELLRATVFLAAGGATALGAISVLGVADAQNTTILLIGAAWWVVVDPGERPPSGVGDSVGW